MTFPPMKPILRLFLASGVLVTGVVIMTIVWEYVFPGHIYLCTDAVGFDFLTPGDWVHGPVEYVQKIDTLRSMSEPDVIKDGWSVTGLWVAWWSMAACVLIAAVACLMPGWRRRLGIEWRI